MKLDPTAFRYITKDEFRVLTAVEMGMRNHDLVPTPLIESIAKLNRGGTHKILSNLLRLKLVGHDCKNYDGFRMTYGGYDFFALRALVARGVIKGVGRRIGVGKESDVHVAQGANGEVYALKLHRLGRISFRRIKEKRDYLRHRTHGSWMYMARLAAAKEFAYMKALKDEGFPVPTPIDCNRHCVLMTFCNAVPMYRLLELSKPHQVLERLMRLLVRLGRAGIVHGDFNEFNLMVDAEEKVTLIDFPQIIHLNHVNAGETFDRDVLSIREFFRRRIGIEVEKWPTYEEVVEENVASGGTCVLSNVVVDGVSKEDDALLVSALEGNRKANGERDVDQDEDEEDDDDSDDDADEDDDDAQDRPLKMADEEDVGFQGLVPEEGRHALGDVLEDEAVAAEAARSASSKSGGYVAAEAPVPKAVAEDGDIQDEESESRARRARKYALAQGAEPGDKQDEDEESDVDGEGEDEEGKVGQVSVHGAKKTRKRQNAKEARKNLQKQQKTKVAKPNCSKNKGAVAARHQIKEELR